MNISTGGASRITGKGAWVTATAYAKNDLVGNNGDAFLCILTHTAGATNEPGVGVDTATYWLKYAEGLTSDQLAAMAGTSGTPSGTNKFVTNDSLSALTNTSTGHDHDGSDSKTIGAGYIQAGTFPAGAFAFTDLQSLPIKTVEIIKASTGDLTAAECTNTCISNYNQGAAMTLTLPAAAVGLNFVLTVVTTGYAIHLKAGASDKIYLDGVALDDADKVSLATPAAGDCIAFFTWKSGASTYDWIALTQTGVWADGGA